MPVLLDNLIFPWKLEPFLLFRNLEKWQRYSGKVIAVMLTVTDPLLPTISKILEKAVHTQLYAYLDNNGIIILGSDRSGTALAHFTDNILQNMDAGSFTGAVFLDLSV